MEPVTHLLTGAVLARAGVNRRAAYATAAMTIAAEFPDVDTLWGAWGPLKSFLHHRGITHTLVGLPFEAAVIVAACALAHRLRRTPVTRAPVHWGWLYGGVLLALVSHIFLDWTNNYGVRPFFPFNPRWYAGSFVFIFEPVLFLILLLALGMPALFGLINGEIGAKREVFRGRPAAIAGLLAIALLYVFRFTEHQKAVNLAGDATPGATRVFASPYPITPFAWAVVTETPEAYQLSTWNTHLGTAEPPVPADTLNKPPESLTLLAAKRSELGRDYLDWSMFPVLTETPDNSDPHHPLAQVTFADARFLYDVSFLHGREHAPIAGTVLLDMQAPEGQRVLETRFNGKLQR